MELLKPMLISGHVPKRAFTLIEVLVFISIFSTAIITILTIVNYAGFSLKNAQNKIFATHYAEELVEWLKYQRDSGGYTLLESKSFVGGVTYCFNDVNISWPIASGGCGENYNLHNFYKRELTLDTDTLNNQINATINTYWKVLGRTSSVEIQIRFKKI